MQAQVVVEQENLFTTRPTTSFRRLSNRSINGGFINATPVNRRPSLGIQQLESNSICSATQGISLIKERKKAEGRNTRSRHGLSHPMEETVSVVSTFPGPLSP